MADTLFDPAPYAVETPAGPELSAQRRRTLRQQQAIANGAHPLALALQDPTIRVHPDAPQERDAPGPRCGSCWFRQSIHTNGNRRWAKCTFSAESATDTRPGRLPRMTHGPGTDVRKAWPACTDYSPGDPSLSPDTARYIPEEVSRAL